MKEIKPFNSNELKIFAQIIGERFIWSEIIDFFKDLGYNFPRNHSTKWKFVLEWLNLIQSQIDGSRQVLNLVIKFCDPRYHINNQSQFIKFNKMINKILKFQQIEIDLSGKTHILTHIKKSKHEINSKGKKPTFPKVFISYSWDSNDHINWIKYFVDELTNNNISVIFDQNILRGGSDLPYFMENGIIKADYVLIICTPKYKQKADSRSDGVGDETTLITSKIFGNNYNKNKKSPKFIPILREGNKESSIPEYLQGKIYRDFRHPYGKDEFNLLLSDINSNIGKIKKEKIMNNFSDIFNQAVKYANLGIFYDEQNNIKSALENYQLAIDKLIAISKESSNPKLIALSIQKATQYQHRIEKLKK